MIRIFLSYSYEDHEHGHWVQRTAQKFRDLHFEVVLDQDHLRPGEDIHLFMEAAVQSSDFVLLICTPTYCQKANDRSKGVGRETALILSEIYDGVVGKFIPILRKGDKDSSIPYYMKSYSYIDLRDKNSDAEIELQKLCAHMARGRHALDIGSVVWEALFQYDPSRVHDQPTLEALKRFTQFITTGKNEAGRWFVIRRDPIMNETATILFQDPPQ